MTLNIYLLFGAGDYGSADFNGLLLHNRDHYYYYYHNHFTASWTFSRTTQVSRYQKGKARKVKPVWIYWSKR